MIRHQVLRQHREDERHRCARCHAGERAEPEISRCRSRRESGDRADQHHAFDAEIQHARFFRDELTERGEHEWRPGGNRRRQDRNDVVDHAGACAGSTFLGRAGLIR